MEEHTEERITSVENKPFFNDSSRHLPRISQSICIVSSIQLRVFQIRNFKACTVCFNFRLFKLQLVYQNIHDFFFHPELPPGGKYSCLYSNCSLFLHFMPFSKSFFYCFFLRHYQITNKHVRKKNLTFFSPAFHV